MLGHGPRMMHGALLFTACVLCSSSSTCRSHADDDAGAETTTDVLEDETAFVQKATFNHGETPVSRQPGAQTAEKHQKLELGQDHHKPGQDHHKLEQQNRELQRQIELLSQRLQQSEEKYHKQSLRLREVEEEKVDEAAFIQHEELLNISGKSRTQSRPKVEHGSPEPDGDSSPEPDGHGSPEPNESGKAQTMSEFVVHMPKKLDGWVSLIAGVFPGFFLVFLSVLLVVCTNMYRQTEGYGFQSPAKSGIALHHDAFHDMKVMKDVLDAHGGKVEEQRKCNFGYLANIMNRPWLEEPAEKLIWGGDVDNLGSNIEYMEGRPWPNGELRDMPMRLTFAFWRFQCRVKNWKWTASMMALLGICPALTAQILAMIIAEIESGRSERADSGFLAGLDGTPREIIFWYAIMMIVVYLGRCVLLWEYGMNAPVSSDVRYIQQRVLRKFMSMKGDLAVEWPAGRCLAVLESDVPKTGAMWDRFFWLIKDVSGMAAAIAFAIVRKNDLASALAYAPLFAIAVIYAIADNYNRGEVLMDLAKRDRLWKSAENAVAVLGIRKAREGASEEELKEVDRNFFETTLIYMYRSNSSWFAQTAAAKSGALVESMFTAIVILVAGNDVFLGRKTFSQFTSTVLLLNIFTRQVAVARVLNVEENFPEEYNDMVKRNTTTW